jgi:hypothetical protein
LESFGVIHVINSTLDSHVCQGYYCRPKAFIFVIPSGLQPARNLL